MKENGLILNKIGRIELFLFEKVLTFFDCGTG